MSGMIKLTEAEYNTEPSGSFNVKGEAKNKAVFQNDLWTHPREFIQHHQRLIHTSL